jgi:hypothetical protein
MTWRSLTLLAAVTAASIGAEPAATQTGSRQRALEPRRLGRLLHAPDALRRTASGLEARLHVPDCTGGTPRDPTQATTFVDPARPLARAFAAGR